VNVPSVSDARGTLKVWGFSGADPLNVSAKSRFDAFKAKFPNVSVELTPGGVDRQKFVSAAAAGGSPDLLYVGRPEIVFYATRNSLLALDPYVRAAKLDMSQFRKTAVTEVTVGGKLYGVPEFANVVVAYVNNRALREAGVTLSEIDFSDWERMANVNRKLTKASGQLQRVGYDPRLPEFTPLWAAANGGAILTRDGTKAVMDSRQTVDAVKYGISLRQAAGGEQAYAAFAQAWDPFSAKNMIVQDQVGIVLFEQVFLTSMGKLTPDADFTVIPFLTHDHVHERERLGDPEGCKGARPRHLDGQIHDRPRHLGPLRESQPRDLRAAQGVCRHLHRQPHRRRPDPQGGLSTEREEEL
jgi:multiple sugar transport system substrate-binding protein